MKRLIWVVLPLLLLVNTADALECIAIKTAAVNPTTRECSYFDNVCQVPSGWTTVSFCPDDDIQFFQMSKYLPSLALLFGSFIGFFILILIIRHFTTPAGSVSGNFSEGGGPSFASKFRTWINGFKSEKPSFDSSVKSYLFKSQIKSMFTRQDQRKAYKDDLDTVAKAIGPAKGPEKKGPSPTEGTTLSSFSLLSEKTKDVKKQAQKTDWKEFKNTLKELESFDEKKKKK